jgi:Replication factor-A C terminal domain
MLPQEFVDVLSPNGFEELAVMNTSPRQMNMAIQYLRDLGNCRVTMRDARQEREVLVLRKIYPEFTRQFNVGDIVLCTIRYYLDHYFMIDFFPNLEAMPHKMTDFPDDEDPGIPGVQKHDSIQASEYESLILDPTSGQNQQKIELINIKVGMKGLQLVGRVSFKTEKRDTVFGNNVVAVANFVMFDQSTEIKVAMFGNTCEQLYRLIEVGKVLRISNPDIQNSSFQFGTRVELRLSPKSAVTVLSPAEAERIAEFPPVLKSLEEIISMTGSRYISFFAKVDFAPTAGEDDAAKKMYLLVSDQNKRRRKIFYVPASQIIGNKIVKDQVYLFERILLKNVDVDPFIQFCPIFSAIRIEGIGHHPVYLEFGQSRQITAKVKDLIEPADAANGSQNVEYCVVAKISEFGNLYYEKCPNQSCFKKASKTSMGYECVTCGQLPPNSVLQLNYLGKFTIRDETQQLEVKYNDKQVFTQIFKISGEQHNDWKKNDVSRFKQLFNDVTNKPFRFTLIKTKPSISNDQTFLVIKVEDAGQL